MCVKFFDTKFLLNQHFYKDHPSKIKYFASKQILQNHLRSYKLTEWKCFQCHRCNICSYSKDHMLEHYKLVHSGVDPECFETEISESEGDEPNENLEAEGDEDEDLFEIGKFECNKCDEAFESFHEFEYHSKLHIQKLGNEVESTEDILYECGDCYEIFSSQYELEKHSKIHILLENAI